MDRLRENNKNLHELFAAPIGLEKVAKLDGEELFGSQSLNMSFLKSMSKTAKAKPLLKTMTRLIMQKKLIPCWMNKNIFKLVKFKIFAPAYKKSGLAFYYPLTKKIYVLVDNNINTFGFSSNEWLSTLTIHEMCHLAVGKNPTGFINVFRSILSEFYQNYFVEALKLKEKPNVSKFVSFIYNTYDVKGEFRFSTFRKYYDFLEEYRPLSVMKDNQFTLTTKLIVNAAMVSNYSFQTFQSNLRNYVPALSPIRVAYREMIGNKINSIDSLVYQELFVPSEVIAILSEVSSSYSSKIYSGLSKLL